MSPAPTPPTLALSPGPIASGQRATWQASRSLTHALCPTGPELALGSTAAKAGGGGGKQQGVEPRERQAFVVRWDSVPDYVVPVRAAAFDSDLSQSRGWADPAVLLFSPRASFTRGAIPSSSRSSESPHSRKRAAARARGRGSLLLLSSSRCWASRHAGRASWRLTELASASLERRVSGPQRHPETN